MLVQLHSGHNFLYQHLHCISKVNSPICPACKKDMKTPFHYLLQCPVHRTVRARLQKEVRYHKMSMAGLLNEAESLAPLFQFINDTGRFCHIFGVFPEVDEDNKDR
ncbi:hypothetical protein GYMLUDRAFT_183068 [Collybiopsis luxurians FD-317 M1]|uniref:Reverse transcriptase zinc-binding domain-containing protein n=1 Tax=Collybiopsis luxurians FD-317 M1 TaxID=944289 RepID=A0A0D0C671_9AGAR|nr:hypothetical protein GYMLUDRAFT_183068 [Collybiopsis luxurians FD-317 M1]